MFVLLIFDVVVLVFVNVFLFLFLLISSLLLLFAVVLVVVGGNKDWEPVEIISFYKVFSV